MQHPHWHYYLTLVDDIERVSRYVDLAEDNYSTYSNEFTRILLAAGSEVDVVAKLLCKSVDPDIKPDKINEYANILLPRYPGLTSVEVSIPRSALSFEPWRDWTNQQPPTWWSKYNRVKHERSTSFREANLVNVLHAVAGLCVFVSYLYYKELVAQYNKFRRPFFFLDEKYKNAGGAVMIATHFALPDFLPKAENQAKSVS